MDLIPSYSMGIISLGLSSGATKMASSRFNKVGNEGPNMSASNIPTDLLSYKQLKKKYFLQCECNIYSNC